MNRCPAGLVFDPSGLLGYTAMIRAVYPVLHPRKEATGPCRTAFSHLVNDELGWLSPETWYRDGDPSRCRINALVCSHRKEGGDLCPSG